MNSNPTPRWLGPTVALLLFLVLGQRATAQCTISALPEPINISLYLDQVDGTARFNYAVVSPYIGSSNCSPLSPTRIRFYRDEARTDKTGIDSLPSVQVFPVLALGYTPIINYDCDDAGLKDTVWVAVNFGAPFNKATESVAVQFIVTVDDNTIPGIKAPAGVSVNAGSNCTATGIAGIAMTSVAKTPALTDPANLLAGQYTDNCLDSTKINYTVDFPPLGSIDVTRTNDNNAGDENFPVGTSRVVYTAVDARGNSATAAFFNVTVTDVSAPSVAYAPGNQARNTQEPNCHYTAAMNEFDPTTKSDNCGITLQTYSLNAGPAVSATTLNGVVFNKGVTTVTWTVTDGAGLTSSTAFTVTVTDNDGPSLTPQTSVSIGTSLGSATPMNLCDARLQWTHSNISDNCSFGVNPLQREITGPGMMVLSPLTPVTPGGTEVFDFPLGVSTVRYVVTDGAGLTSATTFTVTVFDDVAPVITPAPTNQTFNFPVTAGDCSKVVTFTRPALGTVAECGSVTMTETFVEGPDPNVLVGAPAFTPGSSITVQFPAGTTVIRYRWSDNAIPANFTEITYTFNIDEDELPVAKCTPNPLTAILSPTGTATVDPNLVNNGSTDNCGIDSLVVTPTSFTCSNLGAQTVTLTVKDNAGNTSACTAAVNVVDNLPPVLSCPTNRVVAATTDTCTANVSSLGMVLETDPNEVGAGEFYDNSAACGGFVRQFSVNGGAYATIGGLGTYQFETGVNTVTIRVRDASMNVSTCSFTVEVKDLTGPEFVPGSGQNAGTIITKNANQGGCLAQVNWDEPDFVDDCSTPISILKSHNPNSFFFFGATIVSYVVTDAAGNAATHTFTVKVVDTQAPMAQCKDLTVHLNAMGTATIPASTLDNGSTDNCFYFYTQPDYTFNCGNLGTVTRTLTLIDSSLNTASCQSTITVLDTIRPTANCILIPTVNLPANGQAVLNATSLNAMNTDNCSIAGFAVSVDGSAYAPSYTFTCNDLGNNTVTLRVTDGSGNTRTCSQTINVNDVTPPTWTSTPPSITVSCPINLNPTATGSPAATDVCDGEVSITYSDAITPGSCINSFVVVRTWTATDEEMNFITTTQMITAVDTEKPVFSLSDEVIIETDSPLFCDAPYVAELTADDVSDNCSDFSSMEVKYTVDYPASSGLVDIVTPQVGAQAPAQFYPIGTTFVEWFVNDACGNIDSFTVSIIVLDTQAPSFAEYPKCGTNITLLNTPGTCLSMYQWDRPTNVFGQFGFGPFEVFDCGLLAVDEVVSDPVVEDYLDQVNPFNINEISTAFANFPIGTTVITYTAVDVEGNVSTCSFSVTIIDNEPPTLTCPVNQVLPTTCTTASVPNYLPSTQVLDNCSTNLSLTQSPAAGSSLNSIPSLVVQTGSSFTVTVTAKDSNPDNTQTCTFTVTLQDGQAPIPAISALAPIVGFCGADTVYAPLAIDACSQNDTIWGTPSTPVGLLLPNVYPPAYFLNQGNYVITWAYNDGNGNISTQQQFITLLPDNFPPTAKCKSSATINLDNAGNAALPISMINDGSFDPNACGPITLALSKTTFNCTNLNLPNMGPNVVTLTVTDDAGNTATCTANVLVKDLIKPVLPPVPANITVQACNNIPPAATLVASDNCDASVAVTLSEVSTQTAAGFNKYNYTITRTWVATDDSGNSTSGVQVVTVADTQAPVFSASAPSLITVITDPNRTTCDDTVKINMIPFVSDCATGVDLAIINLFNNQGGDFNAVLAVGTYTIVFRATDVSGNSATKSVIVNVVDGTAPTAACINGISVALNPSGLVVINNTQFNANSFDNCTAAGSLNLLVRRLDPLTPFANEISFNCSDADGVTQHPVRMLVTDQNGNSSFCETYVVVQDNVNPTITTCPPSKSVDCDVDLSPQLQGAALATDNCPDNLTTTFTDEFGQGQGLVCVTVTRTWKVADLAGNTATCTQLFNIVDTVKPMFNLVPANLTINCSDTLPALPNISATDNCSDDVTLALHVDSINIAQGACGLYNYTVRRTWTATDGCGNSNKTTQLIKIQDVDDPVFVNFPDTLVYSSANFPPNSNCTVPVTLNIGQYLDDCSPLDELLVTNDAPFGDTSLSITGNYPVGNYKVFFSAADACGNVNTDSLYVFVIDNSIPNPICKDNVVIVLGSNGTADVPVSAINNGSTDNCAIDTLFVTPNAFDCGDLGTQSITLTVIDVNGNSNACSVNVQVAPGTSNSLFTATAQGTAETYFAAADGSVSVSVTGGSGNFSYVWTGGAVTATVNNLPAGTYTVTVTDTGTGCVQTATATVAAGPKLTITIGNVMGAQGETVDVPVTVSNFNKIVGMSFSMHVTNPAVGVIVAPAINSPSPLLPNLQANLVGNDMTLFWVSPNGQPINLPNNTLMFNLRVQLGAAPVGSTSPVTLDGTPTALSFQQDSAGTFVPAMVSVVNGSVTITDPMLPDVKISGLVKTWLGNGVPVPAVTMTASGGLNTTELTDAQGNYTFATPPGIFGQLTIGGSKSVTSNFSQGINVGDLLAIQNHAAGVTMLANPFQYVAGDVNNNGKVDLPDYLLVQQLILGTVQHYSNGAPDWKFVPGTHVFPPTPYATIPVYPQTATLANCCPNDTVMNFTAVRVGDVTGNAPVNNLTDDPTDDRSGNTFKFGLNNLAVKAGEYIAVPFKASGFNNWQAYQTTIVFDPNVLEITDIQPGVLPLNTGNFGAAHLQEGYLTTLWVGNEPLTLADGEVLFTLTFRALGDAAQLSDVLTPGSAVTFAEALDAAGNSEGVDFDWQQTTTTVDQTAATFALYQNQPNPFREQTTIGFRLPAAGEATLRVFSSDGRLVKMVSGQFAQGYNTVSFQNGELGARGVYWYELESGAYSGRKKMVLID